MTDREIIQWLRDEAAYWREGLSHGGIHPDGEEEVTIEMCEFAADRLEKYSQAQKLNFISKSTEPNKGNQRHD